MLFWSAAAGQDGTFVFHAQALGSCTRTYLDNGQFSLVSSQLSTNPAESFMVKVYDRSPGDVPRIAALPAWNEVNVLNGEHWLNDAPLESKSLASWNQTDDTYDGCLLTHVVQQSGLADLRQRPGWVLKPAGEVQQVIGVGPQGTQRQLADALGIEERIGPGDFLPLLVEQAIGGSAGRNRRPIH
jgi:hypothetical protein